MLSKKQANFYVSECEPMLAEFKRNLEHIKKDSIDIDYFLSRNKDIAEWLMKWSRFNESVNKKENNNA